MFEECIMENLQKSQQEIDCQEIKCNAKKRRKPGQLNSPNTLQK